MALLSPPPPMLQCDWFFVKPSYDPWRLLLVTSSPVRLFSPAGHYHVGFVSPFDEADTYVVQHDFMHLSFYKDDFREFVDTLVAAQRAIDDREAPMAHIQPIARENRILAVEGALTR